MNAQTVLITGGCGFIGSHLVDALGKLKCKIIVVDNLSSGRRENIEGIENIEKSGNLKFVKADVRNYGDIEGLFAGVDTVIHAAANVDVKTSMENPEFDFNQNVVGTFNVLEAMRKNGVKNIIFTSSSTVYGLAEIPTPESAPIKPISNYGLSKSLAETLIQNYCNMHGLNGIVVRLANIIGPRSAHGVVYDFYRKLKKNPRELEILGDGNQDKSYLDVKDCTDAIVFLIKRFDGGFAGFDAFNIGSEEKITVKKIAEIVVDEFGLSMADVKFNFTGGKAGWLGDVPLFLLDIRKIKELGWRPKIPVEESIRNYVNWLRT